MTYSNYEKAFKQLNAKGAIKKKYIKHNAPKERSCGKATKRCIRCGRIGAHISKYGLHVCRQCFREIGPKIGFKKFGW